MTNYYIKEDISTRPQLKAQVRSFVQSRSGIRDKDARKQAEKDIIAEIKS
jgi:hypothetical protein